MTLRYAVVQNQWRRRVTPIERRAWYYDWLLTTGDTAPEMRLFGLSGHFESAYQTIRRACAASALTWLGSRCGRSSAQGPWGTVQGALALDGGESGARSLPGYVAMSAKPSEQGDGTDARSPGRSLGQLDGACSSSGIFTSFSGWSRA